jgi:hypothetical protein
MKPSRRDLFSRFRTPRSTRTPIVPSRPASDSPLTIKRHDPEQIRRFIAKLEEAKK